MTSEQRAAAVYDAMMADCPDCHHPWAWHVHGHGELGGCLWHYLVDSIKDVDCCCTNSRPDSVVFGLLPA